MAGVETRADNLEEWQKNVAPLLKGIGQPSWVAWTALAVAILALIAALWKRRSTVEPAEEQEEPARSPTRQQPAPPARPTPPSQGGPKPTLPARPGPAPAIPSPTPAAPPARPAPLPVPNTEPEEENDSAA
ncbi:hypothetical protein HYW32_02415 [Candidatus Berkelbacteria bacterium]|nr:hypothetical protein [Candidatus Berkelbacteria bacterium]